VNFNFIHSRDAELLHIFVIVVVIGLYSSFLLPLPSIIVEGNQRTCEWETTAFSMITQPTDAEKPKNFLLRRKLSMLMPFVNKSNVFACVLTTTRT
jgi:hypothetical protein